VVFFAVVADDVSVVGLAGNFGVGIWLISMSPWGAEPGGRVLAVNLGASSSSETLRPGWWPFVVKGWSRGLWA
jgi:hypothetical protein